MSNIRATWRPAPRATQLAVILVNARKGVMVQTRRHSLIRSVLGIRRVVLAVNKIGLIAYRKEIFDRIVTDYRAFASDLGLSSIAPIAIPARRGDNVVDRSINTTWDRGPCLLSYRENIDIRSETEEPAVSLSGAMDEPATRIFAATQNGGFGQHRDRFAGDPASYPGF
jgi:sulfate adenylyltransferase subunit 1 (EFTu-like GTPase family)